MTHLEELNKLIYDLELAIDQGEIEYTAGVRDRLAELKYERDIAMQQEGR